MTAAPAFAEQAVLGPGSAIQGTRGRSWVFGVGRVDALVLAGTTGRLDHYVRNQSRPDRGWVHSGQVSEAALGPGAIALGSMDWRHGRALEALVPEADGIVHYRLDPRAARAWDRLGIVGRGGSAVVAGHRGRLEALLTHAGAVTHTRYADGSWRAGGPLAAQSAEALVRRSDGVLIAVCRRVGQLVEFRTDKGGSWRETGVIAPAGSAPAALALRHGRPLVLVPDGPAVRVLRQGPDGRWRRQPPLADSGGMVRGVAAFSSYLGGWIQALTDEDGSVFHHHRQELEAPRWMRATCLRLVEAPGDSAVTVSTKLAQVTGEHDTQPGEAARHTLSRSQTVSGVRGTDLGVRIDHAGRTYLLFGDTHWDTPGRATRDSIGLVDNPGGLPSVELHGAPLRVAGGGVTMSEYDVPLDAFGLGDDLFVFFTANHFRRHQVMGRSVLTRARDPRLPVSGKERRRALTFDFLATCSDRHFINVSVAVRPAAEVPGLSGPGEVLLLWGSGPYRASDLRLAMLDLRLPDVRAALTGRGRPDRLPGLAFWTGSGWSAEEEAAAPILPGAFGEVSVRWVPALRRYLLLTMAGPEDPHGMAVLARAARSPHGPWSTRLMLFEGIRDGMRFDDPRERFIRALATGDPVGDHIFRPQRTMTGAAYAPYFFDLAPDGDGQRLRYTLSTWNPYQVVLMQHRLTRGDLTTLLDG